MAARFCCAGGIVACARSRFPGKTFGPRSRSLSLRSGPRNRPASAVRRFLLFISALAFAGVCAELGGGDLRCRRDSAAQVALWRVLALDFQEKLLARGLGLYPFAAARGTGRRRRCGDFFCLFRRWRSLASALS